MPLLSKQTVSIDFVKSTKMVQNICIILKASLLSVQLNHKFYSKF